MFWRPRLAQYSQLDVRSVLVPKKLPGQLVEKRYGQDQLMQASAELERLWQYHRGLRPA